MKTYTSLLPLALALTVASLAGPRPVVLAAGPFRVVVNASNPVSSMSRDEVSRLFLKKGNAWPNGQAAQPVDLSKDSATRKAFSRTVLGRDVAAVESYWQQAIFSGRAVPPAEKGSDAEVMAFVRANPGAIGYVSGTGDLGSSLKELAVN